MKIPRASTVVASVFGIGYFEFAPGTIMSAVAVPLAILIGLRGGGGMGILGASIIVLVIGILACADHVRETGRDDPRHHVHSRGQQGSRRDRPRRHAHLSVHVDLPSGLMADCPLWYQRCPGRAAWPGRCPGTRAAPR